MKVVDLFCGAGGFSLGAVHAGLEVVGSFDRDEILTSSYNKNFPKAKLNNWDLSTARGDDIKLIAGSVDGIIGGPPCQAFSMIGRRSSIDPRRELLGHFFRIVAEVSPKFFVMENVTGLLMGNARKVLEDALSYVPSNYRILAPFVLNAADFGAATNRKRMFLVGYCPDHFHPITEADFKFFETTQATVRDAIADLAKASHVAEVDGFDVWKIRAKGRPNKYLAKLRSLDGTFTGHGHTVHSKDVIARFRLVKQGSIDIVGRHQRLAWEGLCPTLRAGTGNDKGSFQSVRPLHPKENRVITVREAARLQGFPDRFLFHPTVWHSFRMIGNSVSPFVAKAVLGAIRAKAASC
jgi:DNA (cytosine-5)-methyltransferase 1